jgi:hypothetical protein
MEQDNFNELVDMMPYIVFGGAAFSILLIMFINWLIGKINK